MILLIDNYDSFTYNLYQYAGMLLDDVKVARSGEISVEDIEKMAPAALIISPGPGYPKDAGVSVEAVRRFSGRIPILGVCLGHQAIGEAFGGKTVHAARLMHGKASRITLDPACPLFAGLPEQISAARYHSLILDRETLPDCLKITATDESGQIMAVAHKEFPTLGVQFHPESVLTPEGMTILNNFFKGVCQLETKQIAVKPMPAEKRVGLKPYIAKVVDKNDLSEAEARTAMGFIMSDEATDSQIASFITALRMKGETIDEITGFAKLMREKAKTVDITPATLDIVGTGGDLSNSFNVSTTSAFVAAGAGVSVAKHGNRSVSSKSGAADVLEALGVKITLSPAQAAECLKETGMSFLFAQTFHGSMRFAAGPRRETGVRTVFNILGPLANPAHANYMVLGVYDKALLEPLANVLLNLGIKGALLVRGNDGFDEISVSDTTSICEIKDGKIKSYEIKPEDFGIARAQKADVTGGTAADNAKITEAVLRGEKGAARDIVLLNAGAAIAVCGKAAELAGGVKLAEKSIDSGAALAVLEKLRRITNAF